MKGILNLVLSATLFFAALPTHAETVRGLNLQFNYSDACRGIRVMFFRHSSHPSGNPFNRFNESNPGLSLECIIDQNGNDRYIVGGVSNSRDGDAFFFGRGVRLNVLNYRGVSIVLGGDIVAMHYSYNDAIGYARVIERVPQELLYRASQKVTEAERGYILIPFLPILAVGISYQTTSRSNVGCEMQSLAGKAYITSCGYSIKF